MEIYKLKDEITEGRKGVRNVGGDVADGAEGGVLKITDMKQGLKNPNRVNVYVNSAYAFSLDVAQVVELGVKVGRELSDSELTDLKKASEFGKLYQRALEKALTRPHSEREIRDYLYKRIYEKKLDKKYIGTIISRLKEKKYIDDANFARFWVENRFVKKGVSRRRLAQELVQKGVSKEIIEEVLSGRDDEEELRKMVVRKRARYADDAKLMAYLVRQGFSYDLVRKVVEELQGG